MTGPRAGELGGRELRRKSLGHGAFFVPIGGRRQAWTDTIVSTGRPAAAEQALER